MAKVRQPRRRRERRASHGAPPCRRPPCRPHASPPARRAAPPPRPRRTARSSPRTRRGRRPHVRAGTGWSAFPPSSENARGHTTASSKRRSAHVPDLQPAERVAAHERAGVGAQAAARSARAGQGVARDAHPAHPHDAAQGRKRPAMVVVAVRHHHGRRASRRRGAPGLPAAPGRGCPCRRERPEPSLRTRKASPWPTSSITISWPASRGTATT